MECSSTILHTYLEREVWLRKHPFAKYCTVIKDIQMSSYLKYQSIFWAKLEKKRILCAFIDIYNKLPERAKIPPNLTSEGLEYPPEVRVEH